MDLMLKEITKINKSAEGAVKSAKNLDDLDALRIKYLGREKGALSLILRQIKDLPPQQKAKVGTEANKLRERLEILFSERSSELKRIIHESVLQKERLDVTRPGEKIATGHLHPLTKVLQEIISIFSSLGFEIADGPEVETEYYNFDALNIPINHPARDMWDTFWLRGNQNEIKSQKSKVKSTERLLLRTHTSPVQIRYMEKNNPPIRIIVPGRVYRYEATDASHDFQFYQIEGLMVDKNISIANFKAVIKEFFSKLFKKKIEIRLRPSYFPFTEPSFEVDISCVICNAKGCSVCKKSGWLELAGAGMVHPNVFKAAGYNPKSVQGFAFGFGLSRLAMMRYKISDVRLLNSGDLRFLNQF